MDFANDKTTTDYQSNIYPLFSERYGHMLKKFFMVSTILISAMSLISHDASAAEELHLSIAKAVDMALKRSPRIRGARLDLHAAEAKRKQSRAQFGPKLQMDLRALYFSEPPSIGGNTPSVETGEVNIADELKSLDDIIQVIGDDADKALSQGLLGVGQGLQGIIDTFSNLDSMFASEQYDVTFTARIVQPLTPLWAIFQMYKLSELEVDIASLALERQRMDLALQVRQVCLRLIQAEAGLKALNEAISAINAHLDTAKHFLDEGLISKNDLLQIQVRLADIKGKRLATRNGLLMAKSTLAMLLDLPSDTDIKIIPPDMEPSIQDIPNLQQAQTEASRNRPEMKELNLRIEQAERGVSASWQGYIPSISAMAQYQHNEGSIMVPPAWTVGVVANFNVWEWGATYYANEEAQVRLQRAKQGRQELKRGIDLQVRSAWLKILQSSEQVQIAEEALSQAEEQLRLEKERYEVQQNTSTDVLDAQTRLTQAKVTAEGAKIELLIAMAALDNAMGHKPPDTEGQK